MLNKQKFQFDKDFGYFYRILSVRFFHRKHVKNLALEGRYNVQKDRISINFCRRFFQPFGGKLNKENRWVCLAELIPWWKAEEKYAKSFKKKFKGI
ncbi:hypothetical protein P421_16680 [Heyndrickxia coagulans P38]|nr:hypothetical protein P421_16680 [Heyndrickxia coagulans P38]